jgi:hypothetical protein
MQRIVLALMMICLGMPASGCDKEAAAPDGWALVRVLDARTSAEETSYSCRVLTAEPELSPELTFRTPGGAFAQDGVYRLRLVGETRPDGVERQTIGLIPGECALVTYYKSGGGEAWLHQRLSACLPGLEAPSRNTPEAVTEFADRLSQAFDALAEHGVYDEVLLVDAGPLSDLITDARNPDASRSPFSRVVTKLYAGERISLGEWKQQR